MPVHRHSISNTCNNCTQVPHYETMRRFSTHTLARTLITTANLTMQFGAKPLFENVSVKFGEGHRYGLIGANGCGKSTFMKILGGELEPS